MTDYRALFDLTGRTAIVTGGAGILGKHFCQGLAQFGANVVVADRQKQAAEETAHALPGKPLAYALDITQEEDVQRLAEHVVREYGRIDILHNNAAAKPADLARFFDPVERFNIGIWQDLMKVNLDAMFLTAKHIGARMAEEKRGSIIQTASIYGVVAPDRRIYEGSEYLGHPIDSPAVYSASKAGVIGLTKYLASYWGSSGVRVNTLTPGGMESGQNDTFKQKYSARVPMNRMGQPPELVGALLFLASDAASYVTGQNIIVDGGLTAW